jgi:hypothetical protein
MQNPRPADLIREAERYLATVDLFRAVGCEPHWRPEAGARARRKSASRDSERGPIESIGRTS